MRGRTNTWTRVLAAVAAACVASAAQAAPGNGIRLGGSEARLHPFFDFETRYDSNVTYSGTGAVGDAILHFRPGLELKAPGELAAFEFSGALDWAQYLGLEGDTKGLSRFYAYASLAAAFNRNGTVTPRVDNDFRRDVSTASVTSLAAPVVSNMNRLVLAVPWKPGGGALVFAANGEWIVETFEKYLSTSTAQVSNLGYNQYRAGGELQWRFLPRTSGVLQASYYTRVPNSPGQPDDGNGVDVVAGVTGLLTARVAATAKVGYGTASAAAFSIVPATSASSPIADIGIEWLPLDAISLRAGYTRSLGFDPVASIFTQDAVLAVAQLKLAERYAFHVGGRWDSFNYKSVSGYTNSFLRIDPAVDAQFGRWLTGSLGYVYSTRTIVSWPVSLGPSPSSYSKNEVYVRVGVTY